MLQSLKYEFLGRSTSRLFVFRYFSVSSALVSF